ncbi:MAG: CoB--CoM heterodisulfide reductase iron-sulfur subunit B family protein [Planctomycetota bacterium]|jgi:heterodisulfide reductase subunit B
MAYQLFLGCTVPTRARNYEMAARKAGGALGVEFEDPAGFACCGFPLKSVDLYTTQLMAARNLAIAEQNGGAVCTLCSACGGVLTEANHLIGHDDALRERINADLAKINPSYKVTGNVKVRHFTRVLFEEVGPEKIRESVKADLGGLKVAPHYGCHYMKPSEVFERFEDPEHPESLDELIRAVGAEPVQYPDKLRCCGGGLLAIDEKVALTLGKEKLAQVKAAGAEAMALMCPFCSVMYDDNQRKIEATFEAEFALPVLYYPQLLGLALGIEPKALGLNMNRVKTKPLLAKLSGQPVG